MQSKKHSAIESAAQQVVGFAVGLATQYLIFPLYGFEVDLVANLQIGAIFMVVSYVRSYVVRRLFNKHTQDEHEKRIKVLEAAVSQRGELIMEMQREACRNCVSLKSAIKQIEEIGE